MSDVQILKEIPGLFQIIKMIPFRKTSGVYFDNVPVTFFKSIDSIDRVFHESSAQSPGVVADVPRPWYMHPFQDDNLLVLFGKRNVELYNRKHGKIEYFEVGPQKIIHNGQLVCDDGAMLTWPHGVFHRILSDTKGSVSLNFATHHKGIDMKTNFSIYDVNTETGKFKMLRRGELDQL